MKLILTLFLISPSLSFACAACWGRADNNYENDPIQQMYKKNSVYSSEANIAGIQSKKEIPKCDFRLGNNNCKPSDSNK
jgi:hypothetical protein